MALEGNERTRRFCADLRTTLLDALHEELGCDMASMCVGTGDNRIPLGRVAGGSNTIASLRNAVYHATGKRIRDPPIRIEQLV